jgi:hypothetical protein
MRRSHLPENFSAFPVLYSLPPVTCNLVLFTRHFSHVTPQEAE